MSVVSNNTRTFCHVDSRLSQTVALLVVAKMMSGLTVVELCCGLER